MRPASIIDPDGRGPAVSFLRGPAGNEFCVACGWGPASTEVSRVPQTWLMPYGPPPTPRGHRPSRGSRAEEPRVEEPGAESVRVTVDLTPAEYQVLNVWLARASLQLDQPVATMTVARGVRAMIQAAATDNAVGDAVLDVMRKDQS